ncbi:CHAT domain-containing tetratricopeptide repeat protein [Sorangium atrum]|uniref:Tetratricopeptide repeat protein n=1 Tax=Sorangium atrum TaxID=2995308 RepID=A0ABT5CF55_9BACT|nr:tetratricopeptide repeat protein [Sorangium aterium]MDC0685032.1 tetratricopeptide repeat protein [Sorangium aterium]
MATLCIRHVAASDPPQFEVAQPAGRSAQPVAVVSPAGFPVEGRPNSDLLGELQWYLEGFLDYPFSPETEHAERVLAALRAWGQQAFQALFARADAGGMLAAASGGRYHELLLQIWSDDPKVLAWPWEALRDLQGRALSPACRIERRLNWAQDPPPVPAELPREGVNILLVIARPYEADVRFRSIARPLVELIEKQGLPARVHVLRPPTLDRLREHLRERPNHYHVVHFDGHGSYGPREAPTGPHTYGAPEGRLIFEDDHGKQAPVTAEVLSNLLQEHHVPAMVLNACQSAKLDEKAEHRFASVATALINAGTRSVVAMSYSLYVSGAEQFLPAFYRRLFETGTFVEAARAGRQQMFSARGRVCACGRFDLEDWLVPVVYQQDTEALAFAAAAQPPASAPRRLPEEAIERENPYGFIGRDGALLELERALRRPAPAIVIHGLGGVGKTTLARGLVAWLNATEGLGDDECRWLSFHDIRSAEYVFNQLGGPVLGDAFLALRDMEQKIEALVRFYKKHRFLLVWDNFEVVAGSPESPTTSTMSEGDRQHLRSFLQRLRGAPTKVLITSRSEEAWLGPEQRRKISIGGLHGEERWAYCEAILADLGISVDRTDKDLVALMDLLGGHPLAMRAILPRLEGARAGEIAKALRSNLAALGEGGDEALKKLHATLRFVEAGLPEDLRPLLFPLGLHERYVDGDYLAAMALRVDVAWTRERIDMFLGTLVHAGLLRDVGQAAYEMHPALTGFLRSGAASTMADPSRDGWRRAFVEVMGRLADALAPLELHEQRVTFHVHSVNFYSALVEAERLGTIADQAALTQSLAAYARNARSFAEAEQLFQRLAELHRDSGHSAGEAVAYHQLGMVAQERRDFAAAEGWYRKSLAIFEKLGDEHGAAGTYHQLGTIAEEHRDFAAAEGWYRKSLAIFEKHGNEHGAAGTYHHLGIVAQERRDFAAAEGWYRKSLAIKEKHGDEHRAASTYHQLGIVAEERRDFAAAEGWYRKSLAIKEKHDNEHHAASTCHHLGMVAEERRDFAAAEGWYRKSLAIFEKHGDEHGAASTYHHLGIVAQERRDFAAAEGWYRKSLAIEEKQGNEHGAASTYGQLGIIAGLQSSFQEAGRWLIRSIQTFAMCHDPENAGKALSIFRRIYDRAPATEQATLKQIWEASGLGELPPPPDPSS